MIAAIVILNILAMVSACYFFFRSKNDYAVIFFVLSMICMHFSAAFIVVKGTEAKLGVQIFEDCDKILPPNRVYFQVTCLTGMYEQPDAKSRRILELRKRTVLYAYGTRDDWVRVRTAGEITGQKATNALHAIGWVPMCDVKHYPKQKLNILISLVQQIYGLTDFVLDCSQIAIGVSLVMLFRRKRRTIVAITATVFFVLSCLHVIYLFRRFVAMNTVHDIEFLNISLFYVIGMGFTIGISSLITECVVKWIKHHRISGENQQEKPSGIRKGRTKIESYIIGACIGAILGVFLNLLIYLMLGLGIPDDAVRFPGFIIGGFLGIPVGYWFFYKN